MFCSTAPPDYSSVVTEEEAEQNSATSRIEEDLSAVLERPFMTYVQEFRFRPPPIYSEVRMACGISCTVKSIIERIL